MIHITHLWGDCGQLARAEITKERETEIWWKYCKLFTLQWLEYNIIVEVYSFVQVKQMKKKAVLHQLP